MIKYKVYSEKDWIFRIIFNYVHSNLRVFKVAKYVSDVKIDGAIRKPKLYSASEKGKFSFGNYWIIYLFIRDSLSLSLFY